jgi:acyl dehydratase
MGEFWGEEEIKKAKADKSIRDKMKADMERIFELGKPMFCSIDAEEFWLRLGAHTITEDAIRRFCDSIGDVNPLYRSPEYARKTIYGEIIAPPSFLNAVSSLNAKSVTGMPGLDFRLAGFDAGVSVEWFKPLRLGDEFSVVEIPTRIVDLTREDTAVQFLTHSDKVYKNQKDEIVAVADATVMQMAMGPAGKGVQMKTPKVRHFSEQEVEDWYHLMEQEEIRGAEPRFWEDVNVGDQLPPTHHVFGMMECVAFMTGRLGGGSWRFSMGRNWGGGEMWREQLDPESGLPDFSGFHMTDAAAQRRGTPRAAAVGVQLYCWLCHLLTNWMGDIGFLKKVSFQVRRSLYRDSLAICKGEVVKKYVENGEHRVDLKVEMVDHNGDAPIPNASATVILPSRRLENWRSQVTIPPRPPF